MKQAHFDHSKKPPTEEEPESKSGSLGGRDQRPRRAPTPRHMIGTGVHETESPKRPTGSAHLQLASTPHRSRTPSLPTRSTASLMGRRCAGTRLPSGRGAVPCVVHRSPLPLPRSCSRLGRGSNPLPERCMSLHGSCLKYHHSLTV